MTDVSIGPSLLDGAGAPVLPSSWIPRQGISASIRFRIDRDELQAIPCNVASLGRPDTGRRAASQMVTTETAEDLVAALRRDERDWIEREIAVPTYCLGSTLGDLPLLLTTWDVLKEVHLDSSLPLESLGSVSRSTLLQVPGGALALLDLEGSMEYWLAAPDPSPLNPKATASATLEEAAGSLVSELIALDGNRLDPRWVELVLRRQSWGYEKATLEEVGNELGLTRERARQVLNRLEAYVGRRRWPLPPILVEALEEMRRGNFEDVPGCLKAAGLSTDDDWTGEEIAALLTWFGYREAAEGVRQQLQVATEELQRLVSDIPGAAIRRARSKMGLFDLPALEAVFPQADRAELLGRIRDTYARVFVSGDWVMAADAADNMLESGARKQLGVTSPLSAREIYEGLIRIQRNRGYAALPEQQVVLSLLESSGAIHVEGDSVSGAGLPPEPGSISSWLVTLLCGAPGRVMHREGINRAGIRDHINLSSLGVYYLFNPLLRSAGKGTGLVQLVGATPSEDELDHATQLARVLRVPNRIEWSSTTDGLHLEVTMSSNLVATGVVGVEVALGRLWPAQGAGIRCLCTKKFGGRVSWNAETALVGLSPLITHVMLEHGGSEGGTLNFDLRDHDLQLLGIT